MKNDRQVTLVLCQGVEGQCVYLNDYRIAGPKPWGGGTTIKSWNVSTSDIEKAIKPIKSECEDFTQIEFCIGVLKLLKQEAELPTLTAKGFRNYVYKMCNLALQKKE